MSSDSSDFIEISSDELLSEIESISSDESEDSSSSYDSLYYHSDDLERMHDERDTEYTKCAFVNSQDIPCGEDASTDNTRDYCSYHNKI